MVPGAVTRHRLDMKPIKLCIIATVPISIVSFYGKQLDFLKEKGFHVTVITSPDPDLMGRISGSCNVIPVPMSRNITPLKDVVSFFRIAGAMRRGRFDIVQYSSPKAALLGSICGFLFSVPARLYLMWGLYYTGQAGFKRRLLKAVERIVCCFSTHVSPDSAGNREFALSEKLCSASKITVVGPGSANGIDLERFDPGKLREKGKAVRKSLGIPQEAVVIGFVGRLCRDKGINELVKAFKALSGTRGDIYLLLVGPREESRGEYDSDVRVELDTGKRIKCAGYRDAVEEYMSAMDIFVLPSYREGFGAANVEASAMGLPVVSTDIPGPRDAVVQGKTGFLVPAKTIEPLKKTILTLYNDLRLRQDMGEAGKEWARHFDQKILWPQIVEHRKTLLADSPLTLSLMIKRMFDIVFAVMLIVALFPLFFLIGALILMSMGRPIFFIQPRPGFKGKIFHILKFRTMRSYRHGEDPLASDSERITFIGKILRAISFDELPELINVFKGDMSLVGPRPLLPQYLSRYTPEQARRHEVKPGITGWAQVNGRNAVGWEERLKMDVWYVDNRTLWLDIKILFITIYKVFAREGISQPGQATCGEFMGKDGS